MERLDVAKRFAGSLDQDDFEQAQQWLCDNATYDTGKETLVGKDAILASYRASTERARRLLDRIAYESDVEVSDTGAISIRYLDHISHTGISFTHQCRQHLEFNDSYQIKHIRHEDLPGQQERLQAFCAQVGLVEAFAKPTSG